MMPASVLPRIYAFLAIFFRFPQGNYTPGQFNIVPSAGCDFLSQSPVWHLCNTVNNFPMDKNARSSGSDCLLLSSHRLVPIVSNAGFPRSS